MGKEFDPNQDSTRGIDGNEVDTVDSRQITIDWKERGKEELDADRDLAHTHAIISEIQDDISTPDKRDNQVKFDTISQSDLIRAIEAMLPAPLSISLPKPQWIFPPHDQEISAHKKEPKASTSSTASVPAHDARKQKVIPPPLLGPLKPKKPPQKPVVLPKEKTEPVIKKNPKLQQPPAPIQRQTSTTSKQQAKHLNKALKRKKIDKKDPSLVLNTLDFAGQKIYRPMHHCFITRRSMYLVVFNLQDMMKYVESLKKSKNPNDLCPNPIEEVRYWLHSIHAHIYPPDEGVNGEGMKNDDRYRRVCLVGTHSHSTGEGERVLSEEDLGNINEMLENELNEDDRCVDHLDETTSTPSRLFSAVENSLPGLDPKSGAKPLKERMISITKSLKFLDEVYPISWLRFESHLMHLRQSKTNVSCMLESVVESEAKKKGIPDENIQDALIFFHDTGKLILLSKLSFYLPTGAHI